MDILNINQKGLKNKLVNIIASHPKIVTFGIGLAITFVIGTAIGMVDHNLANAISNGGPGGNVSIGPGGLGGPGGHGGLGGPGGHGGLGGPGGHGGN